MIYQVSWVTAIANYKTVTQWNRHLYRGKNVGDALPPSLPALAKHIRNSENDSFIFVVGKKGGWLLQLEKWIADEKLEKYIRVKTGLIGNPVHRENGPNLVLCIMQSEKHFQREEEKEIVDA